MHFMSTSMLLPLLRRGAGFTIQALSSLLLSYYRYAAT